jgi:hypothetical protein
MDEKNNNKVLLINLEKIFEKTIRDDLLRFSKLFTHNAFKKKMDVE